MTRIIVCHRVKPELGQLVVSCWGFGEVAS